MPEPATSCVTFSRQGLLAVALIMIAGISYQLSIPTGSDVSWLIVVAERLLDGQRLYVDVIESNPPMAVFIYMPAVLLQRLTGVSAEMIEILLTSVAVLASLWLCARIMIKSGCETTIERFVIFGAFVLMILPRVSFSEREHLALILMLPAFVLMAVRAVNAKVPFGLVVAAGLGCGIGATIKPHFVVAMLVPAIYLIVHARSLRPVLGTENWIAGGIVVAFTAFVITAYPAYIALVVPMEADTYIHLRLPMAELLLAPLFLSVICVGAVTFVFRRRGQGPQTLILLLAAGGFVLAFVEQGKGWRYQLYPAIALVFLTFLIEILPQLSSFAGSRGGYLLQGGLRAVAGVSAMVLLAPLVLLQNYTYAISLPFVSEVEALTPHPRVFALSTDIGIGHPLSRAVGGTWVSSVCSQLITRAAKDRRDKPETDAATRARMEGWINWDRDRIKEAIRDGQPDVIVWDHATFDWTELVTARPDIGELLQAYVKTADVDGVDLLVRQDLVAKRQSAALSPEQSVR